MLRSLPKSTMQTSAKQLGITVPDDYVAIGAEAEDTTEASTEELQKLLEAVTEAVTE